MPLPTRAASEPFLHDGLAGPDARGACRPDGGPRRAKVLVIEDDVATAELFCFLLGAVGYDARAVGDGNHALASARAFNPTVILSDIDLPGRDGFTLARDFRADPIFGHTPLVAISGRLESERATQAVEAGFARFLAKPVPPETLSRTLSEVLDRRRRQDRLCGPERRRPSACLPAVPACP